MFRNLLTPLRNRFEVSPTKKSTTSPMAKVQEVEPVPEETAVDPEDFARDVMQELMRNNVEKFKEMVSVSEKIEVLAEIHRIMIESDATKLVFRELDGFLVLMNTLSTLKLAPLSPLQNGKGREDDTADVDEVSARQLVECMRLVFVLTCEAVKGNTENRIFFERHIGYESLSQAIHSLVADPHLVQYLTAFLLCFALGDFSLSGIYDSVQTLSTARVDERLNQFEQRIGVVKHAGALRVLWDVLPLIQSRVGAPARSSNPVDENGPSSPQPGFEPTRGDDKAAVAKGEPSTEEADGNKESAEVKGDGGLEDEARNGEEVDRAIDAEEKGEADPPLSVDETLENGGGEKNDNSQEGSQKQKKDNTPTEVAKTIPIAAPSIVINGHTSEAPLNGTAPSSPLFVNESLRYAIIKTFERISFCNHRNHAVVASLGLAAELFDSLRNPDRMGELGNRERSARQKLLKRLLDMGASTTEARVMVMRAVRGQMGSVHPAIEVAGDEKLGADQSLDSEVLDILRTAMKAKWPEHFSMEGPAALLLNDEGIKGLPITGFTFMTWAWFEKMPTGEAHAMFGLKMGSKWTGRLSLRPDGKLEFRSAGWLRDVAVFEKATVPKTRWTHITLLHYPHKASNPTIRLFIDGVLVDTANWTYPKAENVAQAGTYMIGDDSDSASMSWSLASAYLISHPISDDLPRLIHHLGPRYNANFQSRELVRYFTYEASTSLNIFLSSITSKRHGPSSEISGLVKALRDGVGIIESGIVFSLSPAGLRQQKLTDQNALSEETLIANSAVYGRDLESMPRGLAKTSGNVFVASPQCFDQAIWKIGGAAVPLRLVQLATTPHELSRTLGILTDSLRTSWQNSEDMERIEGYAILGHILYTKAQLINMTGFETVFEFMGLNFRSPDHSTIVNVIAYRAIALDFELWSRTRKEIQRVYLEHFATLFETSRYAWFNVKQRGNKLGLVRKLLFVLQTTWFGHDMMIFIMDALKVIAAAHFSVDDVIKPMISYLAANLHEDLNGSTASPRSVISRIDNLHSREKAEQVLEVLISLLSFPVSLRRFAAALPFTRICLLLMGDSPSSVVLGQILLLIGLGINESPAFSRKFELVSGWSVLKTVLPQAWDPSVHVAAFDVLLGRLSVGLIGGKHVVSPMTPMNSGYVVPVVVCPYIMPAIFASLQRGLQTIASSVQATEEADEDDTSGKFSSTTESTMEVLTEELIDLHASSPTFRQVFQSQITTSAFITAYKSFVTSLANAAVLPVRAIRILEKLNHFAVTLALDTFISGPQKREVMDIFQLGEVVLNPGGGSDDTVESSLLDDAKTSRRKSARLSLQVAERAVSKSMARITEWRRIIIISEKKRLRKTVLDLRENRRLAASLDDWSLSLFTEGGLWFDPATPRLWRLDETEGPNRIRKKLEPERQKITTAIVNDELVRDVKEPEAEVSSSTVQVEVPPWAESYEVSATDVDGDDGAWAEDIKDDKHRRVRHELEPGDVIEAVSTVARIVGVDSSPGLLILGRTHLYMLDGLVENEEGEVVDAHNAPLKLFSVPGTLLELDGVQRAQRWTYDQTTGTSNRTCLFRDVALEIYFRDSRSLLAVFSTKKARQIFSQQLSSSMANSLPPETPSSGFLKTPFTARAQTPFGRQQSARPQMQMGDRAEVSTAQRRWQAREISNFTYLSLLNQASGRTPADATQYPVFPWVINDYVSGDLDFTDPQTFRDLTRPMGAITDAQRESALSRYTSLEGVGEVPFHYGTHFSSSMIVCHFLMRLAPYSGMFKTLQGGDWDLPDRLFSDVKRAHDSASQDSRGDVRELIPEFFTCPEFLMNSANIDFGIQQNNGERIHDVKLPLWAKKDPLLFVTLHRQALESDFVSEHLPAWIDLIWGCKQRDPESLNVFHPLSYEGSIDLDAITDDLEREATVGIIHNFGQTPRKLFTSPHPARIMHGISSLPLGTLHGIEEDYALLTQASRIVKDIRSPVMNLIVDDITDRVIPSPQRTLIVPQYSHEHIEWGFPDKTLRFFTDRRVSQVLEAAYATCAVFTDPGTLFTGSSDFTVRSWSLSRKETPTRVTLSNILRGHTDTIICITASRTWSIVVSGSADGSAIIWDLNRKQYVRSIHHDAPVTLVAINESTGHIATCAADKLSLHTVNAHHITTIQITQPSEMITSLAFHEREWSRLGVLATGSRGGTIALRTWDASETPEGEQAQWKFKTLRVLKAREGYDGRTPVMTALKFVGESLVHGEDSGKVFSWDLPE